MRDGTVVTVLLCRGDMLRQSNGIEQDKVLAKALKCVDTPL